MNEKNVWKQKMKVRKTLANSVKLGRLYLYIFKLQQQLENLVNHFNEMQQENEQKDNEKENKSRRKEEIKNSEINKVVLFKNVSIRESGLPMVKVTFLNIILMWQNVNTLIFLPMQELFWIEPSQKIVQIMRLKIVSTRKRQRCILYKDNKLESICLGAKNKFSKEGKSETT
ncbi:hypothetical protein RFI_30338 [Reticulomyxa filosa]|uniref:Uncharacterized protein n=1 Tax=Reticulomyxa filosa TaxID=46433 RepID=X6LZL4_RETFI|nr:hypothetical protein RFI_30338 [Reticulomyxa filosa]|eukprot:ETO07054.1 hypothetical protein RFI_30338 [Reticulomyxa filosa]